MLSIPSSQARAFILARQFLSEPAPDIVDVVRRQIFLQSQLDQSLEHAFFSRVPGSRVEELKSALFEERSLVKTWTVRSTKHTVAVEDMPFMVAAVNMDRMPYYYGWVEKHTGLGKAWVDQFEAEVMAALADGPLSRKEIHERVELVQALPYTGWGGDVKGLVYRGEVVFGEGRNFVRRDQWLPDFEWELPEESSAKRDLLRRYFSAYGPATMKDFAHWAGIYQRDAKKMFAQAEDLLTPLEVRGWAGDLFINHQDEDALKAADPETIPDFCLLPKFDALSVAWRDKTRFLDQAHYKKVYKIAAQIEAIFLFKGEVAGSWRQKTTTKKLRLTAVPFRKLVKHEEKTLEKAAADLAAFYGLPESELVIADDF